MNRMKHFISFLLVVALGSFSFKANAYTERNMLQKAADETTLKSVLVMKQAWVPYPAYTDRAAWDSLMGPNTVSYTHLTLPTILLTRLTPTVPHGIH